MTQDDAAALKWLRDCGWCGWVHDSATNEIHVHTGEDFQSPSALRSWLGSLPKWPRLIGRTGRNIPARDGQMETK